MSDIKYTNSELGIQYNKLVKPQISTGFPFSVEPYQTDENGNLTKYPLPLINATDINWGGANINNQEINTTDELLKLISTKGSGNGGNYDFDDTSVIGIMLNAIRALQSEVVRLRNSLVYGVYSYTGKQTLMSAKVHDYDLQDIGSEEPLWAVDETTLSEILSVDLSTSNLFEHNENIEVNIENNTLTFNELATWTDSLNLLNNITDPKVYIYLTTNGLDITFNLKEVTEDEEQTPKTLSIKLNQLVNSNEENLYNILFILATSVKQNVNNEDRLVGDNFVWIQVGHFVYDGIQQGYYNETTNRLQNKSITFNDTRYIIDSIDFNNLTLSKFNIYSKYQNFSKEIESVNPNDNTDRYKVAHITIRSIATYQDLVEIKDELPENELIYVETGNTLYIKNGYKIKKLGLGGSSTPEDPEIIDTMTNKELIETLKQMGIVYENYSENATSGDYDLQLAALDSVTFINQTTGKKFDISIDAYGQLKSVEQTEDSLDKQLEKIASQNMSLVSEAYTGPNTDGAGFDIRGFNGRLNFALDNLKKIENGESTQTYESLATQDMKLNSDRIRIASIYAPLKSDKIFGCSHGFIEIENSGDKDFYLDGCSIYYTDQTDTYSLPLTGIIPAGGTYLIRCKEFADPKYSPNVYITVDTYDIEWWIQTENGPELLDTSLDTTKITSYALVHLDETMPELTKDIKLFLTVTDGASTIKNQTAWNHLTNEISSKIKTNKIVYSYDPHLVDAITLNGSNNSNWSVNNFKTIKSNSIYKNTFELDPAKQAYNGFNMYESSRVRWNKPGTDSQTLELNKEYIEFPKTKEVKYVKDYTPKASFEHKNVCTDKTQLDMEKPNMPTVSFGIDIFKTRCFNWISCGLYDEYVFLKQDNGTWKKFASYTSISDEPTRKTGYPQRYEYQNSEIADGYTAVDINNSTYARFTFNLPANGTQITAHKCIIDVQDPNEILSEPKVFTYVVGRADKNGNPDVNHCSKELTFTIYPRTYVPRIYQITDQQGFHWIEYQVWAAAALKVLDKINEDQSRENIIPILINTGDAVQAGCRINEWLDYYIGGECLFDHLEQMEIVGNNDLCGTDITFLGTGDDEGKSNSFFYSLFYCYQMDPAIPTLIKGLNNQKIKYIPSLYYFEYNNLNGNKLRFVNVNSEITYVNSRDWFDLKLGTDTGNKYIINPYNGYCLSDDSKYTSHEYVIDGGSYTLSYNSDPSRTISGIHMVSIYEMIYRMLQANDQTSTTKYIVACHEMPFTVVTHANMKITTKKDYRSASGTSLVGSHLNQLISSEVGAGTYWFSRLLEYKGVKLCIGGHKHTYCYTYPLREYYIYGNNISSIDAPMTMESTLKNDSVQWIVGSGDNAQNTSKLPITKRTQESLDSVLGNSNYNTDYFIPTTIADVNDNNNFVTYFMCQATGYKLTSNKELPTPIQAFTQVLPQTKPGNDSDTPDANQKYPMFGIIGFDFNQNKISIKNVRIAEIYQRGEKAGTNGTYDPYSHTFNFNQQTYSKNPMYLQYLVDIDYFNSLYWNGTTYGEHFDSIDSFNKTANQYNTNNKILFNNYGIWTSEETNINTQLSF